MRVFIGGMTGTRLVLPVQIELEKAVKAMTIKKRLQGIRVGTKSEPTAIKIMSI